LTSSEHRSTLDGYGWSADLDVAWQHWTDTAALAIAEPPRPARVLRSDRGLVTVITGVDDEQLPVSGRLRDTDGTPVVGDWVAVADGRVVAILPRRTCLSRRDPDGSSARQLIAANVDLALVAVPQTEEVRLRKLERYLAFVRASGVRPLVVLTKADLAPDLRAAVADASAVSGDADVHPVSAHTGTGIAALARILGHDTVVVVGPSGAGKSTLANALGAEHMLATGAIREDGKGRHTTTSRELVRLASGALLIDTPGLRSLSLYDAGEGIEATYTEITSLAEQCRFRDCAHGKEPGCAVTAAVIDGALKGDRIDGYQKLLREQERLDARVDARLRAERSRKNRAFHRSIRDQPHR
jgi:ribosome biogenesis GTPase